MSANNQVIDVCHCSQLLGSCLDIATPVNTKLSAFYKRSFANHTVKSRMPVILTKLIDNLVRNKEQVMKDYGVESLEELKTIIGGISKLKHDIQTNKQMENFNTNRSDAKIYNLFLKKALDQNCQCSFFNATWLYVECYMYRRVFEFFLQSASLQDFDYFGRQKDDCFEKALPFIVVLGNKLIEINSLVAPETNMSEKDAFKSNFLLLVKLSLWSNKCDLSLSAGVVSECESSILNNITELDTNILCDQSDSIYKALCRNTIFETIDFICDNVGLEIFTDFCLADFLITHQFAKHIRFFVKDFPWFISDVMKRDVNSMLGRLASNGDENLRNLGAKWSAYIENKVWAIEESYFWTTYIPYSEMFDVDEQLFRTLARSKCTFYKGDLNYRKLLGDRNWPSTTPFEEALEGYHPCRLCALRTLKADLICGLREGLAKEMDDKDPDWLISGKYGVIQYCDKVKKLL